MPPHDLPPVVYRFGLFEADSRTGELRRQGRPLKVRGRPFDILLLLLRRAGDVVTRDELRQNLWPVDTFVDFDHGLNSAVNRLREALGDSAENPRFVETLPKRGYRFVAPIEVPVALAGPAPPDVVPVLEPSSPVGAAATPARRRVSAPSRIVLLLATGALTMAIVAAALYLKIG